MFMKTDKGFSEYVHTFVTEYLYSFILSSVCVIQSEFL